MDGTAIHQQQQNLNILDGVTSTAAELNLVDGINSRNSICIKSSYCRF